MKYGLHPACAMWPEMPDNEFNAMVADIKARGLEYPIVLIGNDILDGRNRALACEKAGIELRTEAYTGDDPLGYTVSVNLKRRHLTVGQRALIAVEIAANIKNGGDRKSNQFSNSETDRGTAKAAEALNIAETSVYEAKKIKDSGDTEVIEGVKNGKLSLHKAAKKVKESGPRKPSARSEKKARLEEWRRQQNEAAIQAALRRAGKPAVTPEEFGRPPPELEDEQYPGRAPGVTYAHVHREEHGPIWYDVGKRRRQNLALKLKELATEVEKAVEEFHILDADQRASVRKRWRIAAGRIRSSIDLSEMELEPAS